jgi:flagellar hook assembly protein FlgD
MNIYEVRNFPNPFNDHTTFNFRHNQYGSLLSVQIDIFNFDGQLVSTIGPRNVSTSGYYVEPVFWDGTGEGGSKLRPGFYFYRLKVENELGSQAERIQKLIISR